MTEHGTGEQAATDQWIEELLSVSEQEKMTPKQLSIIQSAIEVFSEKGYSAAATSEIAQKAGVAEGTIFRYYKTKKDLLLSIVGGAMSKMVAPFILRNFNGILEMPFDSYEDFLRAFTINRLEFARKNFKIIRILIQEIPFQPALREHFIDHILGQVLMRVEATIEHFKQKGEIIDVPTPAAIRFSVSAIVGFLLARLLLMPEKDWNDEEEIEMTIQFIMHGIGSGKPAE